MFVGITPQERKLHLPHPMGMKSWIWGIRSRTETPRANAQSQKRSDSPSHGGKKSPGGVAEITLRHPLEPELSACVADVFSAEQKGADRHWRSSCKLANFFFCLFLSNKEKGYRSPLPKVFDPLRRRKTPVPPFQRVFAYFCRRKVPHSFLFKKGTTHAIL